MSTREDFEAWIDNPHKLNRRTEPGFTEEYEHPWTLGAWAAYQAATSRQESKIKALVDALELVSPAEKSALDRAYVNGSNKGNTMTKQYQHWCKQCQRDTRNGHTPFCPATGVAS